LGIVAPISSFDLSKATKKDMPKVLAVAWSGGADSTALLIHLKEKGYDVCAWHVDHGWRQESRQQADILKEQANHWNIPFYSRTLVKPLRNLEAESRALRYEAFMSMAKESACYHLALGHHADDQAETVCMRLLQGAGIAGCQGIKGYRKHQELHIWRPLIHIFKADIVLFLQFNQVNWIEDPSNQDTLIWRNKIRYQLFPLMQNKGVDPIHLFLRIQKQAVKLQRDVVLHASPIEISRQQKHGFFYCDVSWEQWVQQKSPVRVYLLQKMIGILFADGKVFGRRHIQAIEQWKEHGGHGWLNLSGCCLYKQGQYLQLCEGNKALRKS